MKNVRLNYTLVESGEKISIGCEWLKLDKTDARDWRHIFKTHVFDEAVTIETIQFEVNGEEKVLDLKLPCKIEAGDSFIPHIREYPAKYSAGYNITAEGHRFT